MSRDARLILTAAAIRATIVGFVGVTITIYLAEIRFSTAAIGVALGAGLTGGALGTVIAGFKGDALGRRRFLIANAALSAVGYAALAYARSPWTLAPLAIAGMLNGMGRDRGPASALEQAVLPQTVADGRRTWLLAWYNVALDVGHAVGALAAAAPVALVRLLRIDAIAAHQLSYVLCAAATAATIVPYVQLSADVECAAPAGEPRARLTPAARRAVGRLAMLFGIDSFGGGFLSSALIAYWFFRRFGLSETELAALFFTARILNTAGHVAAAWIARRVGLVNTMVVTHLPSSLFMLTAPLASSAWLAMTLFLCREALVEMDVPTRQSYVMAIVRPSERTAASAVTNVTRTVGWAAAPPIAGALMQHALAAPLVVGASLKIAYDIILYSVFRNVRAPEETRTP